MFPFAGMLKCLRFGDISQVTTTTAAANNLSISSGQDSAVHLHLKEEKSFLWGQRTSWPEMTHGLKEEESIYVKLERPSLNREGGLQHYLPPTYNMSTLPFTPGLTLACKPHAGRLDQISTTGPNDSETQSSHVSFLVSGDHTLMKTKIWILLSISANKFHTLVL